MMDLIIRRSWSVRCLSKWTSTTNFNRKWIAWLTVEELFGYNDGDSSTGSSSSDSWILGTLSFIGNGISSSVGYDAPTKWPKSWWSVDSTSEELVEFDSVAIRRIRLRRPIRRRRLRLFDRTRKLLFMMEVKRNNSKTKLETTFRVKIDASYSLFGEKICKCLNDLCKWNCFRTNFGPVSVETEQSNEIHALMRITRDRHRMYRLD